MDIKRHFVLFAFFGNSALQPVTSIEGFSIICFQIKPKLFQLDSKGRIYCMDHQTQNLMEASTINCKERLVSPVKTVIKSKKNNCKSKQKN